MEEEVSNSNNVSENRLTSHNWNSIQQIHQIPYVKDLLETDKHPKE
jgi:hypothetical protein